MSLTAQTIPSKDLRIQERHRKTILALYLSHPAMVLHTTEMTEAAGRLGLDLIIIIIIICCRGSRLITLLSQTPGGVGDCYIIPINIVTHCLPFPTLSLFQQHSSLSACQQERCNRFTYNKYYFLNP